MTTYSISLDDVDLALLPMFNLSHNSFLKKEHFQFELMKQEEETTATSSMVTYTCHICALDVPAAFAREHAASAKHCANARIASVAAQRTRALITALPPPLAKQNGRFCAHCVDIVDGDHEKTKEHRVAVMHDNLLCQLTKAYVGDDDEPKASDNKRSERDTIKTDSRNDIAELKQLNRDHRDNQNNAIVPRVTENILATLETVNTNTNDAQEGLKANNVDIKDKNLDLNNREAMNINQKENVPNGDVSHSTSRWAKLPITKEVNENGAKKGPAKIPNQPKTKHTKEDYEKELRKFMDSDNPFEIKELYHRIHIKIKNVTINVYSDHFHSYHRMYNDGKIECVLCDCTFSFKEEETHKYDLNHMVSVVKIGSDGDFMREINESYSHCILCNQKIKNANLAAHTQSQHHVLRKTNNTKTNINKPKTEASTEQKNKTQQNIEEKETTNDTNEVNSNVDPYKEVKGALWCVVCDCQVPRDERNRKDHVKGLRHVNNLK